MRLDSTAIQLIDERSSRPCVPVGIIDPEACAVRVLAEADGQPIDGVKVTFALEHGPIAFADTDAATCQAMSDSNGRAMVGALFTGPGIASVAASVEGLDASSLRLVRQSDDLTHLISIEAPSEVRAGQSFTVDISCRDGKGRPVTRPRIRRLLASRPIDVQAAFQLRRRNGRLSGKVTLREAGVWSLAVIDSQTNATASHQVFVRPLPPVVLRVLENSDARRRAPFQEALLRVRAEDRFGNAAGAGEISAVTKDASVETRAVGEEAHIVVTRPKAEKVRVDLALRKPRLRTRAIVSFSPAWLDIPPWTPVSEPFTTAVHFSGRINSATRRATISVDFNQKLCEFENFEPTDGPFAISVADSKNKLTMSLTAKRPVRIPIGGIRLGQLRWHCLGEGRTCFKVVTRMSPPSDGWRLCTEQKEANPTCVCVNVIWLKGDIDAGRRGVAGVLRFAELVSEANNVKSCCPKLKVQLRTSPIYPDKLAMIKRKMEATLPNYSFEGWKLKYFREDNNIGSEDAERLQVILQDLDIDLWKENCINVLMIPFPKSPSDVPAFKQPAPPDGFIIVNPERIADNSNIIAHELGHALGLKDRKENPDPKMLMHPFVPPGETISDDECKIIWANLAKYPCQP